MRGQKIRRDIEAYIHIYIYIILHILQLTPQRLSAEHKNCTGAYGASSGQKTRGCVEREDPAAAVSVLFSDVPKPFRSLFTCDLPVHMNTWPPPSFL